MEKKVVVITGSSRGIGLGMARQFIEKGHPVVFNGRNRDMLENCLEEFRKNGHDVIGVPGDITNEATSKQLAEAALEKYGRVDIWINNAGIPQPYKWFNSLEPNEMRAVLDVNVVGAMLGTKTAINLFKNQGFGKVYNMEGLGSDGRIIKKLAVYGTSKRAVRYFTKAVYKELKGLPVQVGLLSPGMVKTEFIEIAGDNSDEKEKARTKKVMNILAHEVDEVTPFLVNKMLSANRDFDSIRFLTFAKLIPKLVKLMFVR